MADPAGFWSYVHDDDKNSGRRILSLADRLSEAFQLLSGEPLHLFVDRDMQWGEEWERRISEALQQTTFFIPIVTPSYFRHPECRKELLQFASAAKQFGVEQFLLPIYYVSVRELDVDDAPRDEAMAIIKKTQWADLRDVRLSDESAADHREVVDKLARRLLVIVEETETQVSSASPDTVGDPDAEVAPGVDGARVDLAPSDEDDGQLELLAKGEEALPRWVETITAISAELEEFGKRTDESVAEMQAENESGNASFASRLAAASRFAKRIEVPADNLVSLGSDYAARLFEVDPAVRTLLRLAEEDQGGETTSELTEFFEAIKGLTSNSKAAMNGAKELSGVLEANAGFSRELRVPLRKIQGALRNMVDAQSMLDEWDAEISRLLG